MNDREFRNRLNQALPDAPEVFYQSVGSRMNGWRSAPFPQNWSYLLVRHFEKERIRDYNRITIGTAEQMQTLVRTVKQILEEQA